MDKVKKKVFRLIFILLLLLKSIPVFADDTSGYASIHGFFQGNYSTRIVYENPDRGDFLWAEERLQLKLEANRESFHLFIKGDAFYDEHIKEKADVELREGYIDYTSENWDLRFGRQIITWGLGDLIFINDVFPKDYEAFFSGRPMEYLKKGVDGVRIGLYPSFASVELIVIPFFEPNTFPDNKRFWIFDPMSAVTNRSEQKPPTNFKNTEVAFRIYRSVGSFEESLYFYHGFFREPSMLPDNFSTPAKIKLFYPRLSVFGTSFQGMALDGVLSFEAGYYDSLQDTNGDDPMVPNESTRLLIGYQRQLWEDFTLGVQYYAEYMHNYLRYENNLPPGFPRERKFKDLITVRLTRLLRHQTMKVSCFSFWSLSERDYMLIPEVRYSFSDHIWAAVGWNIFGGGEKWDQFGQMDKNDNMYVQMRYEF